MRLIEVKDSGELSLTKYYTEDIPRYAILSHIWGGDDDEVTFADFMAGVGSHKAGYGKIEFCRKQATKDGLQFFWVDTCCIDKSNHTELSQAINSMFRWYQDAVKCYVYLVDVSTPGSSIVEPVPRSVWGLEFRQSRWFTRAWTLQELIAPATVEFFSLEGERLGNKVSLEVLLHEITGFPVEVFRGKPLAEYSVEQWMIWATERTARRKEDEAYCLLGIFNVHMSLNYGEGRANAFARLLSRIHKRPQRLNELRKKFISSFPILPVREMHPELGTCQWILSNAKFLSWVSNGSSLLHIVGKPGSGKTVLSNFIYSHVKANLGNEAATFAYFSFHKKDGGRGSMRNCLTSIIGQISIQQPESTDPFLHLLDQNSGRSAPQWSMSDLWRILSGTVAGAELRQSFIILDALDECDSIETHTIDNLIRCVTEPSRTHLLITSRPNSTHQRQIASAPSSQLLDLYSEPFIVADIERLICRSVSRLVQRRPSIRQFEQFIIEKLCYRADGMFLIPILILSELDSVVPCSASTVKAKLTGLPQSLNLIYGHIFGAVPPDARPWLRRVLGWMLFSFRPLELCELAVALAVHHDTISLNSVQEHKSYSLEDDILHYLGSVIHVISEVPQFNHQSVKDFLTYETRLGPVSGRPWYAIGPSEAHEWMAISCVRFLCLEEFSGGAPPGSTDRRREREEDFWASIENSENDRIARRLMDEINGQPFQEYAVGFAFSHAQHAQHAGIINRLMYQLLANKVEHVSRFLELLYIVREDAEKIEDDPYRVFDAIFDYHRCMALHIASAFGFAETCDLLISNNIAQTKEEQPRNTNYPFRALHWAALVGNVGTIRVLLKHGAEVNWYALPYGYTALNMAFSSGRNCKEVVSTLLNAGANPMLWDQDGNTPLHLAVKDEEVAFVTALLECSVDPNIPSDDGQQSLSELIYRCDKDAVVIMELLLRYGANVDAQDDKGCALLHHAVHPDIWGLALQHGANPSLRNLRGMTPLHRTVSVRDNLGGGKHKTDWLRETTSIIETYLKMKVEALTSNGADIDAQSEDGSSALHFATKAGWLFMVKALISLGADTNISNNKAQTALDIAVALGLEEIVRILSI